MIPLTMITRCSGAASTPPPLTTDATSTFCPFLFPTKHPPLLNVRTNSISLLRPKDNLHNPPLDLNRNPRFNNTTPRGNRSSGLTTAESRVPNGDFAAAIMRGVSIQLRIVEVFRERNSVIENVCLLGFFEMKELGVNGMRVKNKDEKKSCLKLIYICVRVKKVGTVKGEREFTA